VPYYELTPAAAPVGGGIERVNRVGYHRRYVGFETAMTKRLSSRWMARASFAINDEREYFDDPNTSVGDPTPMPSSPLQSGGVVVRDTSETGKASFFLIAPRYQLAANAYWQGPWGVNAAASLLSRQGSGQPFFELVTTEDPLTPQKQVLVSDDLNQGRLPSVTTIDIRLEKSFALRAATVLLDFDVFNLANVSTPLRRQYQIGATGATAFNNVLEIVSPRIARLGLRITF
jgi:hypothetical protein